MAHFNIDAVRSYAVATVATLFSALMFVAAAGANGVEIGRLVI